MRNTTSRLTVGSSTVLAIVVTLLGQPAAAATIASWQFEPGDFLADSSGNGNTLSNSGAVSDSDVAAGATGSGSAYFDGGDIMQTVGTLDLTPYRHIRVSWWQKTTTDAVGLPWEQTTNYNSHVGAIVSSVNEYGAGGGSGNIRAPGGPVQDQFPHAHGSGNTTWEKVAIEYNLDSPTMHEVVKVFNDGVLVGTDTITPPAPPAALLNERFFIGARSGVVAGLNGKMDELTIETVSDYVNDVGNHPNVVGYWRLGESAGPTAWEVTGNPGNGTYVNVAPGDFSQEGAILDDLDTAVDFNGSNSYVDCGNDASLNGAWPGLTLAAWVKPDAAALSGLHTVLSKWDGNASRDHFGLWLVNGKAMIAVCDGSYGETGVSSVASLVADKWQFVVGTWDATGAYQLYIDGVLDPATGSQAGSGINTSSAKNLLIGTQGTPGFERWFPGMIDEVAIFNTTFSEAEVLAMYHAAVPEPTSAALLLVGLAVGTLSWRRRRSG